MSKVCYCGGSPVGRYDSDHHTRDDMNKQFASKCNTAINLSCPGFLIHQASFQAYKYANEDRMAVLATEYGLIVGLFDGHYEATAAEYASKKLVAEIDKQISAVLAKNTSTLNDAIPICLVDTIESFDESLHRAMIEKMRELVPKPWNEWTLDDVPVFLGMKEQGEHDPYPIMRRSCTGSTVLIGVIVSNRTVTGEHDMWVASLGDSEGFLGRLVDNKWTATALNDLHNLHNPLEVQRLQEEHPDEDDLIEGYRTKGLLGITRALGDSIFKLPIDLAKVLTTMWGCPVFPETAHRWAQQKHTPPYISSTPSIRRFSVKKGDILVLATDGLRSSLAEKGVRDEDVGNTMVSLAGMDRLDAEALSNYEKAIGHSFLSSADIDNLADRAIRNVLFGLDDLRMAYETMGTMDEFHMHVQDDMSLIVTQVV